MTCDIIITCDITKIAKFVHCPTMLYSKLSSMKITNFYILESRCSVLHSNTMHSSQCLPRVLCRYTVYQQRGRHCPREPCISLLVAISFHVANNLEGEEGSGREKSDREREGPHQHYKLGASPILLFSANSIYMHRNIHTDFNIIRDSHLQLCVCVHVYL